MRAPYSSNFHIMWSTYHLGFSHDLNFNSESKKISTIPFTKETSQIYAYYAPILQYLLHSLQLAELLQGHPDLSWTRSHTTLLRSHLQLISGQLQQEQQQLSYKNRQWKNSMNSTRDWSSHAYFASLTPRSRMKLCESSTATCLSTTRTASPRRQRQRTESTKVSTDSSTSPPLRTLHSTCATRIAKWRQSTTTILSARHLWSASPRRTLTLTWAAWTHSSYIWT